MKVVGCVVSVLIIEIVLVDSILQKFLKIQNENRIPNDLDYRHDVGDITKEFPQYEVGIKWCRSIYKTLL